jgi:hypothetical protein
MTTKKNWEYFIDLFLHILNSCSTNVKQCGQLSPSMLGLTTTQDVMCPGFW